jgi:hypothetical protein
MLCVISSHQELSGYPQYAVIAPVCVTLHTSVHFVHMEQKITGRKGGRGDGKATAGRRRGDGDAEAIEYGTSAGELIEFTGRNRPEGAMLSMDSDPLEFDSERRFFAGRLEVEPSTSRQHSSPQAHAFQRHS